MSHLSTLPNALLLTLDVTITSSIVATVRSLEALTGGRLGYPVNEAGQLIVLPTLEIDIEAAK